MTVEDQRAGGEDVSLDGFPVGMRVLAVDDDPICLIVLENLLRKCQYQVTTTNQAIKALNMLRENRNKFDLVISDVNMPDMDGFKLLELVGLEMDLPVIMLSAHSDTKLVMKGVTHGACDYLLKPIRIEELRNIWQHVVRRRKSDAKDQSKSPGHDKPCHENGEGRKEVATTGNEDQNAKLSRKRKDQNEDEEEEGEKIGHENEDPSTQKKPRVVWSPELHRKFVAAVQQLGVDKAFPKRILDLMNVEGLTRENVASHLQKFRAYLKKASMKPQPASVVAALGGNDNSYTCTGALEGFEDPHALAGSITLANTALSPSLMHGRMLHRLNSSAGLTLTGITSTGLIQPSNLQNLSNNTLAKFQPSLPLNQSASLFRGIPTLSEVNQSALNNPTGFAVSSGLQDKRVAIDCSSTVAKFSSNAFMLPGNSQQTRSGGGLGNCASNFLDHTCCDESWQGTVQPSKFPSTALPKSELLNPGQMHCDNLVFSSTTSKIGNNPHDFASTSSLPTTLGDARGDIQGQDGLIGNIVHTSNLAARKRWEEHVKDYDHSLNQNFDAIDSLVSANGTTGLRKQSLYQNNAACSQSFNESILDQLNGSTSSVFRTNDIGVSAADTKIEPNSNYLFEQAKVQDAFQNSCESLDDMISAMMKQDQNETILMDGEFGFDANPLGSCI